VITFFTIPKPFQGHIGFIQRNAIGSWRHIDPTCEILLFGDEDGTERVAREFKALHIPDIVKNEFGTPLLHDVFLKAKNLTHHRLLCYANADIILFNDFVQALKIIHFNNFLMTGRRWDLSIKERLDFAFDDWQQRLVERVNEHGVLDSVWAMDYFVFPSTSDLTIIPPFAVGRPGWDNWFVFRARELRIPVIDATKAILILHQNHDYNHVPFRRGDTWEGPEADWNWKLVGDFNKDFNLMDATHIMNERCVVSALTFPYLKRRWQKLTVLFPRLTPLVKPLSRALNLRKRIPSTPFNRAKTAGSKKRTNT
jgi:hypothetical protein